MRNNSIIKLFNAKQKTNYEKKKWDPFHGVYDLKMSRHFIFSIGRK